ncbi:MAG: molybdopterin biosynthesis protein, partial [Pseudomonadota bacterium]
MRFGPTATADATGATLAHSLTVGGRRFGKGMVLSADDVAALIAAGATEVTIARIGDDDMAEDAAAAAVAAALAGRGLSLSAPFTGRVNVFAETPGLLR